MSERDYMGTRAEAEEKFIFQYRNYCVFRQPVMGTPKQIKTHDAMAREAESRFVQAAALLAWHMENPDQ